MTDQHTRREANAAATKRLREAHPEEYRSLQREEYARRGLKLPDEERGEQRLASLVEQYPFLKDRIKPAEQEQDAPKSGGDTDDE